MILCSLGMIRENDSKINRRGFGSMSNPAARVYVGRLPQSAQPQDLEQMFGSVGPIKQIVLKENYAFIVKPIAISSVYS